MLTGALKVVVVRGDIEKQMSFNGCLYQVTVWIERLAGMQFQIDNGHGWGWHQRVCV